MQRTCCVSFHHKGGEYSNTAMGESLFDTAAGASMRRTGRDRAPHATRSSTRPFSAISSGIAWWPGGLSVGRGSGKRPNSALIPLLHGPGHRNAFAALRADERFDGRGPREHEIQRFDMTDQFLGYPLRLKGGYLLPVKRRNTILLGMTITGLVSAIFAVMLVLSMVLLFRSRPTR